MVLYVMDTVAIFHCSQCEYHTRQFWRLLKHYELLHSADPRFRALCGIDDCPKTYHNVRALCAHVRSKHHAFYAKHLIAGKFVNSTNDDNNGNMDIVDLPNTVMESGDSSMGVNCDAASDVSVELNANSHLHTIAESAVQDNVAMWSLKLREINKIPGSVCEEIRDHISATLRDSRECLLLSVQSKMHELGASSGLFSEVTNLLSSETVHETTYQTLATEYNVNRYVKVNFGYVEPVEYRLKNLDENDEKVEYMQYIPMIKTLTELLQNDEIFSAVMNPHQSTDGKLRDFCDGSYCRQHPLFASDDHALQIVLYFDDFGAVNPLGHRAKKYKICAFYFAIANVPPRDRSRLHSIHLAALCFSSSVKRCGFDEILKPLVNDLVTLAQNGITVNRSDGTFTFQGGLCAVVADNLAAHSIGGFFESFTSHHPCRFCLVRRDKMHSEFLCDASTLRSIESYESQLKLIAEDQSFQSVYGLKRNSCLNSIPFFHVVSGLPSDVMHDQLEGVACNVIECVLRYCVSQRFITIDFLNFQIENFPYCGHDKINKPDAIAEPIRYRQTAAKCRCFLRLLPAMIGSKIPVDDSKWEVLLLILEIHDMVFCPTMSEADTFLLDDLIEDFLSKFCAEFPAESVKPKMHFMVHYGSHCRMYGPLVQYWTFRFEGKHGYFKDITCRLKCRKNVLLSLAKKHQYYHCWHLRKTGQYLHDCLLANSSGRHVDIHALPTCYQTLLKPIVGERKTVFQATMAEIAGIQYECGLAVVTGSLNFEPCIAVISGLFVVGGKLFIVGRQLENQTYYRHFHLYNGTLGSFHVTHVLCTVDLIDPFPVSVYISSGGSACVILKHKICYSELDS